MSISQAAGAFANNYATNLATLAVTNITNGNYRVCSVKISSASFTVSNLSGGGVTTWTKINEASGNSHDLAIFGGVVTATGAQTITATYSSTPGVSCELWSSELVWSGGIPSSWVVQTWGTLFNTSSTTITCPNLTSANISDQAYWGFINSSGTEIVGSTAGFTYATVNANGNGALFNGTLAASTSYQPTATQSPAGTSNTIGIIVWAFSSNSRGNMLSVFPGF
jgi:hypothetical protein